MLVRVVIHNLEGGVVHDIAMVSSSLSYFLLPKSLLVMSSFMYIEETSRN